MALTDCRIEPLLPVSDLAVARRFYEQQLGLVPDDVQAVIVHYPCAEGTGLFVYHSVENAGKSPATLAGWLVDDLDQTMGELGSRGVAFERYDQPGLQTDDRGVFDAGAFRAAWARDPDGNTMAFTETRT